jgi:flagellar motor protein MotB
MFGWFAHNSVSTPRPTRARLRLEPLEDRTVPSADPLEPLPTDPPPPTEPTVAPPVDLSASGPSVTPPADASADAPPALSPTEPTPTSGEAPTTEPAEWNPWDEWTEDDWMLFWLEEAEYTDWSEYLPEEAATGDGADADLAPEPGDADGEPPAGAAPTETLAQRQQRLLNATLADYPDLRDQLNALATSDPTKFAQVQEQLRQAFKADKGDDENRSNLREVLESAFPAAQPPDTAPAPRVRTGTLADQQKWAKQAADHLAQSAAQTAKTIEALKKQIPTDQADRAYWLKYYEDRSWYEPKAIIPSKAESQSEAIRSAEYVRWLNDRANFVLGADGVPVAITPAGKAKMRELAETIRVFEEYRNKPGFDKIVEALKYARDSGQLEAEFVKRLDEFLKPENLAIFAGFTTLALASGGTVAVVVGGLGLALFGYGVVDVTEDLAVGIGIALGATGPKDIAAAGQKLAQGLSKGAELLGLAAGGVALGKGAQALRGKKATQRADGRVEVVDNPTYGQSAAERAAKLGEMAGERVTPPGETPPTGNITPKPTESAPGTVPAEGTAPKPAEPAPATAPHAKPKPPANWNANAKSLQEYANGGKFDGPNPQGWKKVAEHSEPATSPVYPGGKSIESKWVNSAGEVAYRHVIVKVDGTLSVHQTVRWFTKVDALR